MQSVLLTLRCGENQSNVTLTRPFIQQELINYFYSTKKAIICKKKKTHFLYFILHLDARFITAGAKDLPWFCESQSLTSTVRNPGLP